MNYESGDTVMHATFGLGEVTAIEERVFLGKKVTYYSVSIRDMTVWVPVDEQAEMSLRPPTSKGRFKNLLRTLGRKGETLPEDNKERKEYLEEKLKEGDAASRCQVIRALMTLDESHPLNDNDQKVLKRCREALVDEWCFVLSVSPEEAEAELHRRLADRK